MHDTPVTKTATASPEALMGIFRHIFRMLARARHRHGRAQHAQMHALALIKEHGPMTQRDLLETLDVRSASLSEVLAKLEHAGFIARERDERDKRSVTVRATEAGAAETERIRELRRQDAETVFAALDETEKQQLQTLLGKVLTTLETKLASEGESEDFQRKGHGRRYGGKRGEGHI
ncbi:MAG: hypothetical protein DELT_02325 [Desulfovibrio sp.]